MSCTGPTSIMRVAVASALVVGLAGMLALAGREPAPEHIRIHASSLRFTLEELVRGADAVAIAEVVGTVNVHWNSEDGRRWTAAGDESSRPFSSQPFIYRDEDVRVLRAVLGTVPPDITVRSVGGKVDNVTMEMEGQPQLVVGTRYLMFLTLAETPTRGGVERAWTIVSSEQGIFTSHDGDVWMNPAGLRITEEDIGEVASE